MPTNISKETGNYRGKFPVVDARFWILMFEYTEMPEGMDLKKSLNEASISVEDLGYALSKLCRHIHDFNLSSDWERVSSSYSDVVGLLEELELSNAQFKSPQIVLSSGYFGFGKISF